MRAFVAIELPGELRRRLVERTEPLRRTLPAARWVPAANLHLTLAFLGDLDPVQVERLVSGLAAAVSPRGGFELTVSGAGCFPTASRARVAWLGFSPSQELVRLQGRVADRCRQVAGVPAERSQKGGYRAHLTMARCRRPWRRQAAEVWRREMVGRQGGFRVEKCSLMESRFPPSGVRYQVVSTFPLGGT